MATTRSGDRRNRLAADTSIIGRVYYVLSQPAGEPFTSASADLVNEARANFVHEIATTYDEPGAHERLSQTVASEQVYEIERARVASIADVQRFHEGIINDIQCVRQLSENLAQITQVNTFNDPCQARFAIYVVFFVLELMLDYGRSLDPPGVPDTAESPALVVRVANMIKTFPELDFETAREVLEVVGLGIVAPTATQSIRARDLGYELQTLARNVGNNGQAASGTDDAEDSEEQDDDGR